MTTTRLEIRDTDHPTWRGARYNGPTAEARARAELAKAVGRPGRFALVDRDTKAVLAVSK